jgi:hypothetical protein
MNQVQNPNNPVCFTPPSEASRHEDAWGSGGIAPPFLISALD